jgi:hypothetical protein
MGRLYSAGVRASQQRLQGRHPELPRNAGHALRNTPARVVDCPPGGFTGPGAPLGWVLRRDIPVLSRADFDEVGFGPTNSADFRKIIESVDLCSRPAPPGFRSRLMAPERDVLLW